MPYVKAVVGEGELDFVFTYCNFFAIVRFFSLLKGNVWNHVFVIVSGVKVIYVFEN